MSLDTLSWHTRFLDETPGDEAEGGRPRQVPGKCWSKVTPTPSPDPHLTLWSIEMAETLGLERTDEAGVVLGGGAPVAGMQPYAQRYGVTSSETGPASWATGEPLRLVKSKRRTASSNCNSKVPVSRRILAEPTAKPCCAPPSENSSAAKRCITSACPPLGRSRS